ncbi:MAG: redoxin domain-containing protein [Planctomycetaceae bacterium]
MNASSRYRLVHVVAMLAVGLGWPLAVAAKGPAVGEAAPDFKLPVVGEDEFLSLSDAIESGPVAVVVLRGYPGYQCPLCNDQVAALANRAAALGNLTKRVILVYPGEASVLEEHAEEFIGSRTLPEPLVLVRDPDMKMVTAYGLRWDAPNETAYPAAFVINRHGQVKWSKISDSHGGRASAQEIVEQLGKL